MEKKVLFQKALNQLPEKQKTALLMNKMQGLTYKEIAEVLNLSQKAIEKRIGLALKALKQNLNQRWVKKNSLRMGRSTIFFLK